MKISHGDMGAAPGADVGADDGLGVVSCPNKLDDPRPTAQATSSIRLIERLGLENMRQSSTILHIIETDHTKPGKQ